MGNNQGSGFLAGPKWTPEDKKARVARSGCGIEVKNNKAFSSYVLGRNGREPEHGTGRET